MCTVVIRVPEDSTHATTLLAIRDEDPERPWRPYGQWWAEHPDLSGVQDVTAGGAWLATAPGRLAVALNRLGTPDLPPSRIRSRGALVLSAALGVPLPERFETRGVNLVTVTGSHTALTSWDGTASVTHTLTPGTHMIAHGDVDDDTARIRTWLRSFSDAPTADGEQPWWSDWLTVLRKTTKVGPFDDRAIVRDNRPVGYPTASLLVAAARVSAESSEVVSAPLDQPGIWNDITLQRSLNTRR